MSGTSATLSSSVNAMTRCAIPSLPPLTHSTSCAGVDGHSEAPLHETRSRVEKSRRPAERRIAVRARIGVRARDRIDDWLRRWLIGIADAQVDQIGAARASAPPSARRATRTRTSAAR